MENYNLKAFKRILDWQNAPEQKHFSFFSDKGCVSLAGILEYFNIDLIMNNYIHQFVDLEFESGSEDENDEIYQYFIINANDYDFLLEHFPHLFAYMKNEDADLYMIGVYCFGMSWRGVNVSKDEFKNFTC